MIPDLGQLGNVVYRIGPWGRAAERTDFILRMVCMRCGKSLRVEAIQPGQAYDNIYHMVETHVHVPEKE